MDVEYGAGVGALYLLASDLPPHKKVEGLTISNGIAWSLDDKRLYHIEISDYI